jgi:multidrug resistance efflux pump
MNPQSPVPQDEPPKRFGSPGRAVRFVYATVLLGLLGYGLVWLIKPLVFLEGPGEVKSSAIEVAVPYVAKVKHIHVSPGQSVHEGAVLAVVSRADAAEVSRALSLRLHNANMKRSELRNRLAVAQRSERSVRDRARVTADRLKRMQQPQYCDQLTSNHLANLQREQSEAAQQEAAVLADLRLLPEAIAEVEAEIHRVTDEMNEVNLGWGHILLSAVSAGTVGPKMLESGATVSAGQSILTIYDSRKDYVLWRLPALSLRAPVVNEPVTVLYGRSSFPGTIRSILTVALDGDAKSTEATRLAEVEVKAPPAQLPIGAEVTVRLTNF